jgi:molybdopterin-containing oxidoreductase family iron-sulfur binding subunit
MKRDAYGPIIRGQDKTHWRSLEDKANDSSIVDNYDVEFPNLSLPRRDVLKLGGAAMAIAGLGTACFRRPEEEILPYTHQPEEIIPGIANYYATVQPRSEGAVGLVVEAHEGRPTKIEGNALHPASMGAADIWAQAEVLKLYDPDRAHSPLQSGKQVSWGDWDTFAKSHFAQFAGNGGQGLAILLEDTDEPTVQRVLDAGLKNLPNAKLYRWDPLAADNARMGAEAAFGPGSRAHYDFTKAKVVLALDTDFLFEGPDHLKNAKTWSKGRKILNAGEAANMSRLYAVEGVFSTTGASADHRFRLASGQAPAFLKALAAELAGKQSVQLGALAGEAKAPPGAEKFISALAADLAKNKGASLVVVGERQPAAVHALACAINSALGAVDAGLMTVSAAPNAQPRTSMVASLASLAKALTDGQVQTLLVIEANPLYTAPGALKFADAIGRAKTVVHAGVLPEETGAKATWHVPLAHFLESWGDARAWDGTAAIVQPLVMPLFDARPAQSLLAQVFGMAETNDKKLVGETWRGAGGAIADERAWRKSLHDGVIANSAYPAVAAAPNADNIAKLWADVKDVTPSKDALEVVAYTGNVLDGRLANVPWVQELPDPMTKLCWDNAFVISPSLANALGITSAVKKNSYAADVVELSVGGRTLKGPVFVLPGYGATTIGVPRGYGKRFGETAMGGMRGPVAILDPGATQNGTDVNALLEGGLVVQGVKLTRTNTSQELCSTQDHFAMPGSPMRELTFAQMSAAPKGSEDHTLQAVDGRVDPFNKSHRHRPHYKQATLKMYQEHKDFAHDGDIPEELVAQNTDPTRPKKPLEPVDEVVYEGQQWGMVIDLTACMGCGACTVACQAENNIATVGRHEVLLGRELHWIRIDRYFSGDVDEPASAHQPVPCMQCENAPCEPVCPVAATTHDEEGLNSMAYNRCIGTRYCSNNCPYKVRRFNYLDFTVTGNIYRNEHRDQRMLTAKLQRNPNVTVRYRGVMEKCTYCTQRIEEAKYAAKRRGEDRRALPDGAVTPACAQTCPTDAITFGNVANKDSRVSRLKLSDRNYEMLQELNVRPRTTFLARLKNTNEELG